MDIPETKDSLGIEQRILAGCLDIQRLSFDTIRAFARCQGELFLQALEDVASFSKVLAGANVENPASRHAERAQNAYTKSVNNWRDLTDRMNEAGAETASLFSGTPSQMEPEAEKRHRTVRTGKGNASSQGT